MPPGLSNTEAAFADSTNGLLLNTGAPTTDCQTELASIGRTMDGAASWQQVTATGIASEMCKSGLSAAADSPHAWFTAYRPNSPLVIYHTADRGQTWTASAPLPGPPGLGAQGANAALRPGRPRAFGSIVLVSVDAVVGGQLTRYVLRSTDAGATFTFASIVPTGEGSVAFVTAARWLVIGTPNASQQTVDGGASWQPYPTDYSQAAPIAPDVVFGDANVGYATVRGAIQRTTDGGAHWTTIKTPGTV